MGEATGESGAGAPRTVDEYVASFPPGTAEVLERFRAIVHAVEPTVTEAIRYDMAAMLLDGRYLTYFAGWKTHVALYSVPRAPEELEARIAPYRAAKDTLRFPLSAPVPYDLVEDVVRFLRAGRAAADAAR